MFKKLLLSFSVLLGISMFDSAFADIQWWVNFQASVNSGVSYQSSLSWVTVWTDIIYKFRVLTNWSNLNTWYIYFNQQKISWWLWSSNTCPSVSVSDFTDSVAKFSFKNSVAGYCVTEIYFKYKAAQSWNKDFNYNVFYPTWSLSNSFILRVNSSISLVNAYTLDSNSNWYIDWYALRFSTSFASNLFNTSYLTIRNEWVNASSLSQGSSYTSWWNYYINAIFSDNIWHGWIRPELSLAAFTNGAASFSSVLESAQIEIDNTRPILKTINSYPANSSSIQINSNDSIVLKFSEPVRSSTVYAWTTIESSTWAVLAWTWWVNTDQDEYTFTPSSSLSSNLSINLLSTIKDWSNNWWNTLSSSLINLSVNDTTVPVWEPIWVSTWVNINAWVTITITRYVNLSLKATDNYWVYQMMIANDAWFTSASWQTYSENVNNWQLTAGDWLKTVYVKFKDAAWNVSSVYSDSINFTTSSDFINLWSSIATYVVWNNLSLAWWCSYDVPTASLMLEYSINSWAYQDLVNCNNSAWNKSWSTVLSWYPQNATNSVTIRFKAYPTVSMSFSFIHDNANPTWSISINSWATYASDRVVSLALNWTDSSWIKRIYLTWDIDLDYRGYQSYVTTKAAQLTSGDGPKVVQVQYEDNAWNLSAIYSDSITLDTTAPIWTVSINAWSSYTTSLSANLTISATDTYWVSQMMVSQDVNFVWATWESYSTSKSISLSSWDGTKTVYIKFKDTIWNISWVFSDSIVYDITKPSTTVTPLAWSYENSTINTVELTCSDLSSSCYKTYYKIWWWSYSEYSSPFPVTWVSQSVVVTYYSVDNAWNSETPKTVTYVFSTSYLNIASTVPTYFSWNTLLFTWNCNNAAWNSDIEYKINSSSYTGTISCSWNQWSKNLTLLTNTTNVVTFRLKNNISKTVSSSLVHDNVVPTWLTVNINAWAAKTNSRTLHLALSATDLNTLSKVYITWDVASPILTWYATSLDVIVTNWDWLKTLYIKVKDLAWNWSSVSSDNILLDAQLPVITVSPWSGTYSSARSVSISLNEVWTIYYSFSPWTDLEPAWNIYTVPLTISSTSTLYVQAKDTAWNKTLIYSYTYNISTDSGWSSGWGWGWWGWSYYRPTTTTTKTTTTKTDPKTTTGENTTQINDSTVVIESSNGLTWDVEKLIVTTNSDIQKILESKRLTWKDLQKAIEKYNQLVENLKKANWDTQTLIDAFKRDYNNIINSYPDIIPSTQFEDKEFEYTLAFLRNNDLTKYNSVDEYRPFDQITRQEAAKFFTQFAINVLWKKIDNTVVCDFSDLDNVDPSLEWYIMKSCQLWIFKWTNGKFKPNDVMKKSEAIAVLIRIMVWTLDESWEIWFENYFNKAIELWFIKDKDSITWEKIKPMDIDRDLTRYEAWILIYRANQK